MIAGLLSLMTVATAASDQGCTPGAYRSPEGIAVAVFISSAGSLRYTFFDGRRGALGEADGVIRCVGGQPNYREASDQPFAPVPIRITRTDFQSQGIRLAGELIEAPGAGPGTPLVVMAHGSENTGWTGGRAAAPFLFAAQGVSTFIFDKSGTGDSEGDFHMNFPRLARDVAAATEHARSLADGRFGSIGIHGFSQGGWVAPLAAATARPDFVVVNYGLVLSPLEEDAEEVQTELLELGFDAEVLARAREVTDATGSLLASGFREGFDKLAEVKQAYGNEPWFSAMRGEFTGRMLAQDEQTLRREGRSLFDRFDIVWDYDPVPPITALGMPLLWVAAGSDRAAPPELTLDRLTRLQSAGHDIQIATFPGTDHGIVQFIEAEDGSRTPTHHAEGYFRLLVDWSTGCVQPPYGAASLSQVRSREPSCQ